MDSANQPVSPSRQSKSVQQQEYRDKETKCFNALQDVIDALTGEKPRTRYDTLAKAIDILTLELRGKQNGVLNANEAPSASGYAGTSHMTGYPAQLPLDLQLSEDFVSVIPYDNSHFTDQHYNGSSPNQPGFQSNYYRH